MTKRINFSFIGWWALLILHLLMAIIGYLDNGVLWPINLLAVIFMVIMRYVK